MRSSTLGLLFLISVQAVANMRGGAPPQEGAGGDTVTRSRTRAGPVSSTPDQQQQQQQDSHSHSIPTVDPKLFQKRRYRSPRVLFSVLPPDADEGPARGPGSRVRRRASQPLHRGEYSVCDSISNWVGNKTKATDISGNEVTVLPDVNINNVVKKQFFFETTCRSSKSSSSGCRGIDSRHWNSYCTNTHTYVRALTSFKNLVAFRLIRINAACVCVLSRKSWRH
ncbi:neurotrophin-7 [Megalops cyprinoides]|uniref:neurotrophin-7 n=1 Tax=Megalops cyprinoides TaxID=118141 RepID=UPI0018642523|nr:neurotrophin-7 [Megalops cyprinoides]